VWWKDPSWLSVSDPCDTVLQVAAPGVLGNDTDADSVTLVSTDPTKEIAVVHLSQGLSTGPRALCSRP
jgi:hypothetical protein